MSSDTDSDKTPPRKKSLKYEQKFMDSWLKDDRFRDWLKKSAKGNTYLFFLYRL